MISQYSGQVFLFFTGFDCISPNTDSFPKLNRLAYTLFTKASDTRTVTSLQEAEVQRYAMTELDTKMIEAERITRTVQCCFLFGRVP